MAQCSADTLAANANCFTCLPSGFYQPLKLALLLRLLSQKMGVANLVEGAVYTPSGGIGLPRYTITGLTPGQVYHYDPGSNEVELVTPLSDPPQLLTASGDFTAPSVGPVYIYGEPGAQAVTAVVAIPNPSIDVDSLVSRAQCFFCLTPGQMQIARLQLLCNLLGGNVFYSGSNPSDSAIVNGDPAFFISDQYAMSATNSGDTGTPSTSYISTINWTFPKFSDSPWLVHNNGPLVLNQLILQRSASSRATPFSPTGAGSPNTNGEGFDQVAYALLPADAAWATLLDLRPNYTVGTVFTGPPEVVNYPMQTSFQDSVGANTFYNYRLIGVFSMDGGSTHLELDWNVVTVVTPYILNAVRGQDPNNPGQQTTALTWSNPDLISDPGSFHFISYTRCPCSGGAPGCGTSNPYNRIIVDSSHFSAPTTYDVYKSTDGITWPGTPNVSNAALNQCNEWYDSCISTSNPCTSPGAPWYYRFVAHTPSGDVISNTILAN